LIVGEREEGIETIVEHIGVLGMFVKDNFGDFDITEFGIENGSLTEDIDTLELFDVFENFIENVVGRETKGIIDVENKGVGFEEMMTVFDRKLVAKIF
jgi:hypothetical protein